MAVRITRKDKSAGELRQEAARCRDGKAARRMLAIALVLDGVDRKTAAENCGMDRQTLRDWAHRYNAEGVSGLFKAVLHQSPDKRGVPLPVKMVSQLTQTWHSQVRSFC